jgi:uncharacterized RDD family membrane protein YckC
LTPPPRPAGVTRRLASGLYELLILLAVVFIATLPFSYAFGDATHGWRRHLLQAWVFFVVGAYFLWFWTHGGQTLPLKTWRLRVLRQDGTPVRWPQALHRYGLSLLSFFAVGLGFWWAFFDREKLFLHDRLAGTYIADANAALPPKA